MMKKVFLTILAAMLLLAILFTPIPQKPHREDGERIYSALTYKIVDWNEETTDGVYDATKFYWFPNNFKSIDELWTYEEQEVVHKFVATVIGYSGDLVIVEPVAGEDELQISDRIAIGTTNLANIGAKLGSDVEICYLGKVMPTCVLGISYTAQAYATKWTLADNLRHREYTGQWLDKETAKGPGYEPVSDIIITRIYSNCFFARAVIPYPYEIKVNGQLSEEWCVGDQVNCTYENTYYDEQNNKIETDLLSISISDFELEEGVAYKPVIYLYPEVETEVSVKLQLDGKLTCTYPAYNTGWKVTAAPDGTLTDAKGQIYNYLYWEGETNAQWDLTQGFCVKGEDTAAFLEDALAKLGLNRKEANEFIVYWLPLMEQNPYNIISFQTDTYTDAAQLQIAPTPDTLIRVFMAWRAADAFTELEEQELTAPERTGFTVVEWGGTQLP